MKISKLIYTTKIVYLYHGIRSLKLSTSIFFPNLFLSFVALSLTTINVASQAPLKLTSTNYMAWKLQFQTLFIGYDLIGYVDGTKPCPPATSPTPNPANILWIRQDQLILNAIIGSLSPTIIPFVATAKTSQAAWTILANTYAKPSR